ncbi:fibroblast growth factor 18-like isoform X2 [Acanthaster planci]|uniref:Fibroblast growth factor 18-like isoform X2 n=1 Tax=Acanthaster planci TaxID=133434 RepID=A0A8B7YGJ3_ACAPL|nr:fibroblast growth factor 18-like isoform X2 [Acanthaster planci]
MSTPLHSNSCFVLISGTRAMFVVKRIVTTLLHIIIIWCLSVQESVQQDYENSFDQGLAGIDFDYTVSKPTHLQLYSRASAKHLRIMGRNIDANGSFGDPDARLLFRTNSLEGQITIQGEQTGYFLCINKKGHVVGRRLKKGGSVSCVFTETINNGYTELKLVQKTEMYLGFNRDGRAMRAQRTRPGVKSVQFLKRSLPESNSDDESSMSSADIYRFYQLIQQMETNNDATRQEDTAS